MIYTLPALGFRDVQPHHVFVFGNGVMNLNPLKKHTIQDGTLRAVGGFDFQLLPGSGFGPLLFEDKPGL